jgi:hypothetical protein
MPEAVAATTTSGAPSAAAPTSPQRGAAPSDALSRLAAAGVEDMDEPYEDLDELGEEAAPSEGVEDTELPSDEDAEQDGEEKPEDTLGLKGKGSRESPLKHKELPADRFVELKTADGKRVVVSLKDAVSGTFMSRDIVDRHVSLAQDETRRARQLGETAVKQLEQANAGFEAALGDPVKLLKLLIEHREPVLHQLAYAYAKMRKDPSLRQGLLTTIREERIAAQQRDVEQRRRALQQQEQETTQYNESMRTLGPAYRQGLKEAGIIHLAQSLPDDLQDEIRMRFEYVKAKNGGKCTPEQMVLCVKSAAKAAGYPKGAPPRPAAAAKPPEPTPRAANGKRNWDTVPHEVRMKDPDFLFSPHRRRRA